MKKNTMKRKLQISGLVVLILFGVFATCILSVLLTGASAYRRLTDRDQISYENRTYANFLATKIRQAETPEAVSVSSFDGQETLVLSSEIDGDRYLTSIYCYDGWIRELFAAEGDSFSPSAGEKIMEAQSLSFSQEKGLVRAEITPPDGETIHLILSVRGKEADFQ